jgi:hypothetical protein
MISGRFRSEYLCRHWSDNRLGFCQADTCVGVVGDLEHLLVHCPALAPDRERLWDMFFSKSVHFPALVHLPKEIEKSEPSVKLKFLLDPFSLPIISKLLRLFGQNLVNHIYYLLRTYAYYLHRRKQILTGNWSEGHINYKKGKRKGFKNVTSRTNTDIKTNSLIFAGQTNVNKSADVTITTTNLSSPMPVSAVHSAHVPSLHPVTTAVASTDQLNRANHAHAGGWDGGVVRVWSDADRQDYRLNSSTAVPYVNTSSNKYIE